MTSIRSFAQLALLWLALALFVAAAACSSGAGSAQPTLPGPDTGTPGRDPGGPDTGDGPLLHFDDPRSSTGSLCPEDASLTYDSFARDFFGTYCTRCHGSDKTGMTARNGAPGDHNFDSLPGVQRWIPNIDLMAAAGPKALHMEMPLTPPDPSDDERRKLGAWLACREGLEL